MKLVFCLGSGCMFASNKRVYRNFYKIGYQRIFTGYKLELPTCNKNNKKKKN